MPVGVVLATVAAYVLIGILLLSLNLTSRWRWWVKGGAIVLTTIFFAASYLSISSLLGWPTRDIMPARLSLVATRIVEPDAFTGAEGSIFLWVEELDSQNVPSGRPRAYELAYTEQAAEQTAGAQSQLNAGEQVQVEFREQEEEQGGQSEEDEERPEGGEPGRGDNSGGDFEPMNFELIFNDMPAVPLPEKGPL
ncbi:MAG: hypothetical protein KIS96_03255 [Bauldia sp.]|nr:hypothetical protein [Bauldia sp.]MCW5777606.1 hypothetical protein [Phycisphaeraceae bacterium]